MSHEGASVNMRILMVDDEAVWLEATADLLRLEGFLVDTAQNGLRGRAMLLENAYDFLISDLVMPGNKNLELLHAAVESNPDIKIIVITGYPSIATAQESIQLPVLAYLVKPPEMDELLGHLHQGSATVRIHHTLSQSRERTQVWLDEMAKMQDLLRRSPRALDPDSARTILGLSLGNLSALILEMKEIFDQSFSKGDVTEFCAVRNCPRLIRYQNAVEDAIEVMERTKSAFKSKDLAQLRERLQNLNSENEV
jgi:ActR/RegA family two-component response regulator